MRKGRNFTVDWKPWKHGAGFEASADFVDPGIIESHPSRLVSNIARLNSLPESFISHVSNANEKSVLA